MLVGARGTSYSMYQRPVYDTLAVLRSLKAPRSNKLLSSAMTRSYTVNWRAGRTDAEWCVLVWQTGARSAAAKRRRYTHLDCINAGFVYVDCCEQYSDVHGLRCGRIRPSRRPVRDRMRGRFSI